MKEDTTLQELIYLTKKFIELADELFSSGKITHEEYEELTYIKRDFLKKAYANENNIEQASWKQI